MKSGTMDRFTLILSALPEAGGRPVLDRTGLQGHYSFTFDFRPYMIATGGQPADSSGPSFFTALQEQLGLKLESQKGPVEMFVIDSVEKPSGN